MERLYAFHASIGKCSTEEYCLQICCKKLVFGSDILYYHCWCGHWKQKSLHTLFVKHLDHILVNFEQNRMVRTIQNFEVFHEKWLTIFDKGLTPFWMTFLWVKKIFDAKLLIQRLSSFSVPKFTVIRHV